MDEFDPDVPEAPRAQDNEHTILPKHRSGWWKVVGIIFIVLLVLVTGVLLVSMAYQGPASLPGVLKVMPGVPIFPLSEIAPRNRAAQRGMAIPLMLIHFQGAQKAEVVQLHAPADADFVLDWYRRTSPSQRWSLLAQEQVTGGTRLLFVRGNEGLQVLVGKTRGGMVTPVQLLYIQGLTTRQLQQMAGAGAK